MNMKGEKIVNLVSEHIVVPPIVQKTLFRFIPYKGKPHSYIRTYSPMSTYTSSGKYALRFETSSYGVAPEKRVFHGGCGFRERGEVACAAHSLERPPAEMVPRRNDSRRAGRFGSRDGKG